MTKDIFGTEDVPEYYVDSAQLGVGAYGIMIALGVQGMPDTSSEIPQIKRLAIVRMSPQHALILAKLLQKHVDIYQEKMGRISLPRELFEALGLEPE